MQRSSTIGHIGLVLALAGFGLAIAGAHSPLMEMPFFDEPPPLKSYNSQLPWVITWCAAAAAFLALVAFATPWRRLFLLISGITLGFVASACLSLYREYDSALEMLQQDYDGNIARIRSSTDESDEESVALAARDEKRLTKPSDVLSLKKVRKGAIFLGSGGFLILVGALMGGGRRDKRW